jgi:hypothetical protein
MQFSRHRKAKGTNFRWADLVSGNLKEEKEFSLHPTAAFQWPPPLNAQLVASIGHRGFRHFRI